MFTLDQIKMAHSKVKSGTDFPKYIQELISLGVTGYQQFVANGRTVYFGENGFQIESGPKYLELPITDKSDNEQFIKDLKNHQNGNTDYLTFCSDCAKSGVEKWAVDTEKMTCIYYDNAGNEMLAESIL